MSYSKVTGGFFIAIIGVYLFNMKYFLHDTNSFDDEKITELYMKFGYEGLGLFYTLLEKIAKQEKPVKSSVLKSQLKIGKRLEKCWKFMEKIDLISSKNGETFNEQLLNFSEMYHIKKEKTRIKVAEWREKQTDKENVTSYVPVSNSPKVKESKVKESKVTFEFENFRVAYPGTKRGYEIEFDNLKKKHSGWKEIIPTLYEKLSYQIEARKTKSENGGFIPEWKNLQTWINNRCWEEEININIENKPGAKDPNMSTKYL